MEFNKKIHKVIASDGEEIGATEFSPKVKNIKEIVLINSATGVKQNYYFDYCMFLVAHGFTVFVYDYRGVGSSLKGNIRASKATYMDWGKIDYPSMVGFIKEKYPSYKFNLIGHSIGGVFVGVNDLANDFDKIVTVCSQHGYWRNFPKNKQFLILFTSWISMPVVSFLLGYYPSKIKGLGESIPKRVAWQWAKLLRNKRSIFSIIKKEEDFFKTHSSSILLLSIYDDWIASKQSVDILHDTFPKAKRKRIHLTAQDCGNKAIGHVRFFSKSNKETIWNVPLNFLQNK